MEILSPALQAYAEQMTSPESDVLYELNRYTHLKVDQPNMLSGHVQGQLLSMISYLLQPQRVLEVGTFTGYSAICLAQGMLANGLLYTIDSNEELEEECRKRFAAAGLQDKIRLLNGKAADIIPGINETFDLAFIDADKTGYSTYFDLIIDKIRPGGFLLADNVLYHGEVLDPSQKQSNNARAIHAFNQKVAEDPRVEQVLLTVRDGLLLMRKK